MKRFVTSLLLGTATIQAKDIEDGFCPKMGSINSRVAESLDLARLQGEWTILFDEKELINQFICLSVRFLQFDPNKANELSFQQANSIYEVMRQHLRETGEKEMAAQKYFVNSGRKAVFQTGPDKSVAQMQATYKDVIEKLQKPDDINEFNEVKFSNMFAKYM